MQDFADFFIVLNTFLLALPGNNNSFCATLINVVCVDLECDSDVCWIHQVCCKNLREFLSFYAYELQNYNSTKNIKSYFRSVVVVCANVQITVLIQKYSGFSFQSKCKTNYFLSFFLLFFLLLYFHISMCVVFCVCIILEFKTHTKPCFWNDNKFPRFKASASLSQMRNSCILLDLRLSVKGVVLIRS